MVLVVGECLTVDASLERPPGVDRSPPPPPRPVVFHSPVPYVHSLLIHTAHPGRRKCEVRKVLSNEETGQDFPTLVLQRFLRGGGTTRYLSSFSKVGFVHQGESLPRPRPQETPFNAQWTAKILRPTQITVFLNLQTQ